MGITAQFKGIVYCKLAHVYGDGFNVQEMVYQLPVQVLVSYSLCILAFVPIKFLRYVGRCLVTIK